ncbi:MAG: S1 RNA-binding domain-containing protein [Anaerolineae bacterium]
MIHISKLAEGKISHPSSVVKKGDELTLRLISVNAGRRRIGLSLRQAPPPEEPTEVEEEPEPELAPDNQATTGEVEETAEASVVPEEEAEEPVEVEEEPEPGLAPEDQASPGEVRETVEAIAAPEEAAVEIGDEAPQVETDEETPQES